MIGRYSNGGLEGQELPFWERRPRSSSFHRIGSKGKVGMGKGKSTLSELDLLKMYSTFPTPQRNRNFTLTIDMDIYHPDS